MLRDVSFTVRPGETVAIVGETGSGKSTLTKLVNRIYDVDRGPDPDRRRGRARLELDSLRSQISTIEQDIVLFSRTVAENIAFSLGQRADREAVIEARREDAQAHELHRRLHDGYETVIGERGVTLSGGQRQRLAIARALLTDPRILILDDSTSAIDSATEDQIQQAIRRVARRPHHAADHPPPLPDPLGRQDPGAQTRRAGRPRHARRAAGAQRALPAHLRPLRRGRLTAQRSSAGEQEGAR